MGFRDVGERGLYRLFAPAELGIGVLELLLDTAALADIACEHGEPAQPTVVAAQRREDRVGPELRAVVAQSPSLVFDRALARRRRQVLLRLAVRDVLVRIEPRERVADDVLLAVSVDALSARHPALHSAFVIVTEDRVVRGFLAINTV